MDGLSLIYGQNPRKHMWSFASAGQLGHFDSPTQISVVLLHQALLVKTIFVHLVTNQNLATSDGENPYFSW